MNLVQQIKLDNQEESKEWKLNPYSNPVSHSTMIFAFHCDNRFYPIGTISFIGKIGFMISASHVFDAGLVKSKANRDMRDLIERKEFQNTTKGDLGFSAIRFNTEEGEVKRVNLIGLDQIAACIPGDIFYASPFIANEILPIEYLTLQPAMPEPGQKVYSCGYTNFDYDLDEGFCLDEIKSGRFNWKDNFSFDFKVYEGEIQDIYINKFVESYLNAPCFTVNYKIPPGLSGGPTFNEQGIVCGVNSASLSDQSLISLIYPTVFTDIRTTLRFGPLTMNNIAPIIQHMSFGNISTDGSEENIKYAIRDDKLSAYHRWAEYLNSRVYKNRSDQESNVLAKPIKKMSLTNDGLVTELREGNVRD